MVDVGVGGMCWSFDDVLSQKKTMERSRKCVVVGVGGTGGRCIGGDFTSIPLVIFVPIPQKFSHGIDHASSSLHVDPEYQGAAGFAGK